MDLHIHHPRFGHAMGGSNGRGMQRGTMSGSACASRRMVGREHSRIIIKVHDAVADVHRVDERMLVQCVGWWRPIPTP
jgi:hypothetical protein